MLTPWRRVLGAPVRFGAERNALLFPTRWLNHRLEHADPNLRRGLEEKIAELERVHPAEFPSQLRGVVRTLLRPGVVERGYRGAAFAQPTDTTPAPRSSRRHPQGPLDETRYDLARHVLAKSRASMIEISAALAYANLGARVRSIAPAGCSPAGWRERNASHAN
jgi:hypothetical protein